MSRRYLLPAEMDVYAAAGTIGRIVVLVTVRPWLFGLFAEQVLLLAGPRGQAAGAAPGFPGLTPQPLKRRPFHELRT